MTAVELPIAGPFDLVRTLSPLVRGAGDRTIRLGRDRATWTTRRATGPATVAVALHPGGLRAEAWGPGADDVLERLPAILGLAPGDPCSGDLHDAPDPFVAELARRLPGIRITRTGAIIEALVPAILEQKVTGDEARRAWRGLVRDHGDPAPGPVDGLRVAPAAAVLARLPYFAYHPYGVEQRRAELIRRVSARATWFEEIAAMSAAEAHARLVGVSGIGPWTAAEVGVRALGDADAVSVGDFHLPHLVAWALRREPRGDDTRMLELLAPYAGRRALVVRLLEASGVRAPRYGPRLAPRRIEGL